MIYLAIGLKAAQLIQAAQAEGRQPNDDDVAALKESDEYRALAEKAWADTLPKPTTPKRTPPNRAR